MKPVVYLIHRWDAAPTDDWYPWLKDQLTSRGYSVQVPAMPRTNHPIINDWVSTLATIVGTPQPTTYFIGHSIGCQTIVRYLARLPETVQINGAFLVAPWIHLINLEDPESEMIAKPWTETPIDWQKAKTICPKFTCLFSDTDPWVPLSEALIFKDNLNAQVQTLSNHGHITDVSNPIILDEFLKLTH